MSMTNEELKRLALLEAKVDAYKKSIETILEHIGKDIGNAADYLRGIPLGSSISTKIFLDEPYADICERCGKYDPLDLNNSSQQFICEHQDCKYGNSITKD